MAIADEDHGRIAQPPTGGLSGCGHEQFDLRASQVLALNDNWGKNSVWRGGGGMLVFHGFLGLFGVNNGNINYFFASGKGPKYNVFGGLDGERLDNCPTCSSMKSMR
jgi:hypothetical protein